MLQYSHVVNWPVTKNLPLSRPRPLAPHLPEGRLASILLCLIIIPIEYFIKIQFPCCTSWHQKWTRSSMGKSSLKRSDRNLVRHWKSESTQFVHYDFSHLYCCWIELSCNHNNYRKHKINHILSENSSRPRPILVESWLKVLVISENFYFSLSFNLQSSPPLVAAIMAMACS